MQRRLAPGRGQRHLAAAHHDPPLRRDLRPLSARGGGGVLVVVIIYPDGSRTRHRVASYADAADMIRRAKRMGCDAYHVQT